MHCGVAIKSGLKLTYQQYEGVRYILSHHFDEEKGCHVRNLLPRTGAFLFFQFQFSLLHPDHFVPTLPTIDVVQKWVRDEMTSLGLSWEPSSAKLDPLKIMKVMVDGNHTTNMILDILKDKVELL